jgi:hypothetical protein
VSADRDQMVREQRATGIALVATLVVQSVLSFTRGDLLSLLLPAFGLGIVMAVLTLRSENLLSRLRRKRTLLAGISLGLASLFALSLLIDDPRNLLLTQFSRSVVIDCAFLGFARLCGSFLAGHRKAYG